MAKLSFARASVLLLILVGGSIAATQSPTIIQSLDALPSITNPNLKVEVVSQGLGFPSSMAFLGPDDILVLEKNTGMVKRIVNGVMLPEPLLDVNVATQGERGMLGIAVVPKHQNDENNDNNNNSSRYVFLYYTEAKDRQEGKDRCPNGSLFPYCKPGNNPLGNRLYRYELVDNNTRLVNPTLLLDLPATPNRHNGGALISGPDGNIYLLIGDINHSTKAQNFLNGNNADGSGGILRISPDGKPVGKGIIGDKFNLGKYYAYGIRNGFGIDFDPVTGKLWDTEDGPTYGDEINLVEPGFNSGWSKVQGIWDSKKSDQKSRDTYWQLNESNPEDILVKNPRGLVNFNGNGKYSAPELAWNFSITPTAIKFLNSDKLGKQYQNDMFVGDFNNGSLYHFDLNKNRTGLVLNGSLADKIADNPQELQNSSVIFGKGFGAITHIEVGPHDGYLYVLSLYKGGWDCRLILKNCVSYNSSLGGTIFRIFHAVNLTDS